MKKIVVNSAMGILMAGVFTSCGNNGGGGTTTDSADSASSKVAKAGIQQSDWGETDGKKVFLYTLTNEKGVQVKITNYGGIVTSFITPTKSGASSSIVLGFDELSGYRDTGYLAHCPYFGSTVGRYGNRIADAKFTLDGKGYTLARNNGKNSLHGGLKGFDKVVWDAAPTDSSKPELSLNYLSKDREEGFPGNLKVSVKFSLSDDNELTIDYNAETDKATPVNLTNHSYWNLTGDAKNTILDHTLMIDADKYTPVDTTLIPTGELKSVKGTTFDFTSPGTVGSRIDSVKGGYDHNWVLNHKMGSLDKVATVTEATTGRTLEVYTTEPGIQFYSGNFLDGSLTTSYGTAIQKHSGMCLETQHFPDSPNRPAFPSTILKPGEKYHTTTKYKVILEK